MLAAANHSVEIIHILIANGAKVNAKMKTAVQHTNGGSTKGDDIVKSS